MPSQLCSLSVASWWSVSPKKTLERRQALKLTDHVSKLWFRANVIIEWFLGSFQRCWYWQRVLHKTADLICEFACVYIILFFFSEPRSCSINMWLQSLLWTSETDNILPINTSAKFISTCSDLSSTSKHTTHLFQSLSHRLLSITVCSHVLFLDRSKRRDRH